MKGNGRYPGFIKKMRKSGKKIVSYHRYEFETMKRFALYCAEKENRNPLRLVEYYPLFYQYRFAKYLHRNRNKPLT